MEEIAILVTAENTVEQIVLEAEDDSLWIPITDAIGGFMEIVRPRSFNEPYIMIVDEEGLLKDKPINLWASFAYGETIVGDVLIMKEGFRNGEPDIIGLESEDMGIYYDILMDVISLYFSDME